MSRQDGLQDWSVGDIYPFTVVVYYDPDTFVSTYELIDAIEGDIHGRFTSYEAAEAVAIKLLKKRAQ